jgi:hypothetical protein
LKEAAATAAAFAALENFAAAFDEFKADASVILRVYEHVPNPINTTLWNVRCQSNDENILPQNMRQGCASYFPI